MHAKRFAFIAALCLATSPLAAAHPIDGTWRTDPEKIAFPQRPQVYLLKDGKYTCESCTPAYSVAADGMLHPTPGRPYADEVSVTIEDEDSIKVVQRQKGKDVGMSTMSISDDDPAMMEIEWQSVGANGKVSTGEDKYKRTAPTPAGAHAISGGWQTVSVSADSESSFEQTFMMHGNMLHLTTPDGESYAATLGGPAVPIKGDRANTMVKVAKTGDNSFVETGIRDGKTIYVMSFTVAPDGKSIDVTSENKLTNATTKFVAYKQ